MKERCGNVHIGTCIAVTREALGYKTETIMVKRIGSHGAGTWCVPGGWFDYGESDLAASAEREFHEEVGGVEIKNVQLAFKPFTNDFFKAEGKHFITAWYVAEWVRGEPQLMEPDHATEVRWVTWWDWPGPLFLPMANFVDPSVKVGAFPT